MRACKWVAASGAVLTMLLVYGGRAEPPTPWIALEAPRSCQATAAAVGDRVRQALLGQRAPDLQATVSIEEREGGYQATVRTARAATVVGVKVVSAATCDEALDAAVVVLAMALGEQPATSGRAQDEPAEPAVTPPAVVGSIHAATSAPVDTSRRWAPPAARRVADHADAGTARGAGATAAARVSLVTGADTGTAPLPTMYVGAGVGRDFGPIELRAGIRYGLPRVEEEEEAARSEQRRADFGAVDVSACYGLGARWRASACAGAEAGVIRSHRRLQRGGDLEIDTDAIEPRVAGVLGALVGYRGGAIQPQLEIETLAAAGPGSWLAFRAGFGVAVQF